MSKIVIDAREYSTSTGRYISNLLKYLEQIDFHNDYVVLLKPADMDRAQFQNPHFSKLACPYKEFTFAEQFGLARQLNGLQADLVHFGATNQPILYRRPVVTTVHDLTTLRFYNPDKQRLVFWAKQQILKLVLWAAAHKSQRVITPTEFVRQDLVRYSHVKPAKVSVTYEAADKISDAAEPLPELAGKQFLLYVGRPTPHKNLERLITAFQILQKSQPELRLVLAGKMDKNYTRIQQKTNNEQITNIIYTGFVSEGQLRWLYENCASYVFPSLSEGFGLPGLEAMVHGAPVVSSNATCLPEVYGDAAHYFDPQDVSTMAQTISDVLTDKQLCQTLVAAGYAQTTKYSWQTMAWQTMELYQQSLKVQSPTTTLA